MSNEATLSTLRAADGHEVVITSWPAAQPVAQIHLLHGLGEHVDRYARFASLCNSAGFSLTAHSHRGHGRHLETDELGHYADAGGWDKVVNDVALVHKHLLDAAPDLPMVLIGHSMGSYIAQSFLVRGLATPRATVLSASTYAKRSEVFAGHWLARLIRRFRGPAYKSPLLNKLGFGDLNKPFEPARTIHDWLSRDDAEVDKYVEDPYCGADASSGLWVDLTGGLLEITRVRALANIAAEMPLLITGGARDPVGGDKGMGRLADAYAQSGHTATTLKTYPDGRHEMFNETNRDEFMNDVLDWIRSSIGTSQNE